MKKIQIRSIGGKVLFEHEAEGNTIKKTLEAACEKDANLRGSNLRGANLRGANLRDANLRGSNLRDAKNIDKTSLWFCETRILPEGDIVGYKKCINNVIVKLLIPSDAKRSHATGRKCRSEFAKVLEIFGANEAISSHDNDFVYRVGEVVRPSKEYDEDCFNECSTGIHFFITRTEAENY